MDPIVVELFNDINTHLLNDKYPSLYLEFLYNKTQRLMIYPFNMIERLKLVEQSPIHHPEGNVWNHTMLVIDMAAKEKQNSSNPQVFMWAALLHDIGKFETTKIINGRITAHNHDKVGAVLADEFLKLVSSDIQFIEEVSALVRWHMQILFVAKNMKFAEIKRMKSEVDIKEIAWLGYCDRIGRKNVDLPKEQQNIKIFLDKCSK